MEEMSDHSRKRTMKWQVACFLLLLICGYTSAQLHYSIPEELKQGSMIGNIAKDLGLKTKELQLRKFHIFSRGNNQYFNINLQNGELYVTERIDREILCGPKQNCLISFEAVIENPLHLYTIKVQIEDINDNPPSFSQNIFDTAISESALPGVRLALGLAQDPDIGVNSVQDYRINENEYFSLGIKVTKDGIKHPELTLEKPLDREKQSIYDLTLTASDGGTPAKTGTALVRIIIQDVNDNFPKFNKDIYESSINENVPIGFLVLQLNAIDEDEGSNAKITYLFRDIPESIYSTFRIDPVNGSISVISDIDYEVTDRYELTVEAKDGGNLAAHCKIYIDVIDINDNAPEITVTSLLTSIPEDSPPAMDNGSPQLSTNQTVQLNISDVNDNPPAFEKENYTVYVQENNLQGTSIYSIHASDCDSNKNARIIYSVLGNKVDDIPVSSYVSINSVSGVIYAQRSFDYEQLREFQFQVMAKDSGSPSLSSNVTVRICIIDKNDNAPKILYPSPDSEGSAIFEFIPHSAEKGYLVSKVIAVDADSGHNAWLFYHLLQVQEPSLFAIDQHNGEIRISRDLPDMDPLRQKVLVIVKDNGSPSLSSTVTLSLVVAENFQQVVPEIRHQPINSDLSSNTTFYLIISITLISVLFIVTVVIIMISKFRKTNTPTSFGAFSHNVYPQFTLGCPSEISDTSLPFPVSYDVCVTLDSKQNEIAYLKPVQNVPTDNLIDTEESTVANNPPDRLTENTVLQQAQPGAEWRFSQAQRPGPSGAQPAEEAGVWPNNQFETERLQAMILASANEAAEGTSGLGGGTGTMGLSARYGPQFTLQHVPDYRQNVYIPGSTLTPTNAGGKRDGKGGGNKKKSGKKEKK
ncbi:protocadherin gamma-B1-like isoform X23 [Bufo gargarizans]|uniref:protocadherin gamma-B1-like isoform X23 n=1 Tax=Bufo gargarizans TaxID=30331 RepID=UPI001CF45495|nr:protocadherin gamma-B1-like isoform X23 [Bufo gargarizans]